MRPRLIAPVIGVDYNFITNHLATGGAISLPSDLQPLIDAGITHIINCRAEFDDSPLLAGTSLQYLWNPADDDGQPKPIDWFAKSLQFALPALSWVPPTPLPTTAPTHPRVYVHCAAGVNRGPSTAYAIMLALDWPADLAEAQIRKVRPFVGLAYKADAQAAATALGY